MSVQPVNLALGNGLLYAKREDDADGLYRLIGSLKGETTFTYAPEFVEQKPGDLLTAVRRDIVEEKASMKCQIVDFRVDQLINLLGISISTTSLTATTSFRIKQELLLGSTTATQSFSYTAKSLTSVVVTNLDRSTTYVSGTDYTLPSTKKINALTAGTANTTVNIYITALIPAANRIRIGDKTPLQVLSLKFVHQLSDKKHIQIDFPRATINSDFVLPFKEKEYTMTDITFAALGDPTKPQGQKLFTISRQQ